MIRTTHIDDTAVVFQPFALVRNTHASAHALCLMCSQGVSISFLIFCCTPLRRLVFGCIAFSYRTWHARANAKHQTLTLESETMATHVRYQTSSDTDANTLRLLLPLLMLYTSFHAAFVAAITTAALCNMSLLLCLSSWSRMWCCYCFSLLGLMRLQRGHRRHVSQC